MPVWVLGVSYWLHMLATIVWVGGLALLALVVWPGAQAALGPGPQMAALMQNLHQRFMPLSWMSLGVLMVTGLTQMAGHPRYEGFLQVNNTWAMAILLKHVAVGGMMLVGGYMQWMLHPTLVRLALLETKGKATPELASLRQQERRLTQINLVCGVVVLAFTAVARVF